VGCAFCQYSAAVHWLWGNYTYGDLLFIQVCAVSQQKCTAALVWARCIVHCSVVLCKTGSQQGCVTASTLMEICSSYRCAVSQQKCTAALGKAKSIPHCSVGLCKTGSQQLWCHCNCTHGGLRFIQGCNEPTEMHCSTGQGKTHCPLFKNCSAKQAHSRLESLQSHLW